MPDLGLSNLASARRALEALGHEPVATCDPSAVAQAACVVLPGVGAFGEAARRLSETGLGEAVRVAAARGAGIVGICLGMQLLFESSEEGGSRGGLGLLPGRVVRLSGDAPVPHVGWNRVRATDAGRGLLAGGDGLDYYFVHSFVVLPADASAVAARCRHGEEFVAAVAASRVIGFQFHPEKSGAAGLALLGRAIERAAGALS
jgi:glutamine amidotransferase